MWPQAKEGRPGPELQVDLVLEQRVRFRRNLNLVGEFWQRATKSRSLKVSYVVRQPAAVMIIIRIVGIRWGRVAFPSIVEMIDPFGFASIPHWSEITVPITNVPADPGVLEPPFECRAECRRSCQSRIPSLRLSSHTKTKSERPHCPSIRFPSHSEVGG